MDISFRDGDLITRVYERDILAETTTHYCVIPAWPSVDRKIIWIQKRDTMTIMGNRLWLFEEGT